MSADILHAREKGEPDTVDLPSNVEPLAFAAHTGKVFANGVPFSIKGLNWYGSEGRAGPPSGLAEHSVGWYIRFIARNDFQELLTLCPELKTRLELRCVVECVVLLYCVCLCVAWRLELRSSGAC